MAENTAIEWATHTLNWWTGCEPISPGCAHCYAKTWAARAGRVFEDRRLTTEANRQAAFKWQKNAEEFFAAHGHRQRVFVNSLSDWADNKVPQRWRDDLFTTIRATPDLDYLLLTKRIGNVKRMLPADWGDGYSNVWIGISVVNQEEADRDIPKLLTTPTCVRFLSCEPLLGEVDLNAIELPRGYNITINCPGRISALTQDHEDRYYSAPAAVDWVIVGGESGPRARPCVVGHVRRIVRDCQSAGVSVLVKQLGRYPVDREGAAHPISDRKGGDIAEWPIDLRVRQFPRVQQ